jgi:ubiquinone/menaquinone biosynthesis C-methylase UbiE
VGASLVSACDPSPPFVAACLQRHPGVDVLPGSAEELPFADSSFDIVMSQLVLHFVSDPVKAAAEMTRVLRPGGTIAACVWDFGHGMRMLTEFWEAALSLNPDAPAESVVLRFGRSGELTDWLTDAGLAEVTESTLATEAAYTGFDELWDGFLAGIGPAGSYCVALLPEDREALRVAFDERMGRPREPFTLEAVARVGRGVRR